jgi:hypothetical protein
VILETTAFPVDEMVIAHWRNGVNNFFSFCEKARQTAGYSVCTAIAYCRLLAFS